MKVLVILSVLATCAFGAHIGLGANFNTRVVGGEDAKPGEYAFQGSLQMKTFFGWQHICGCSLVDELHAITAGHCKIGSESSLRVVFGITNLNEEGEVRGVKEFRVHEGYKGGVGPYDIAVITFDSPMTFGKGIEAVKLPRGGEHDTGDVELSGWGSTSHTSIPHNPKELQKVTLPLLSQEECEDALIKLTGTKDPLADSNICAGPLEGGKSACNGDSGGPLSQDGFLVGVVSWGFVPCASRGAPSVYTRVSSYLDWIKKHTQ